MTEKICEKKESGFLFPESRFPIFGQMEHESRNIHLCMVLMFEDLRFMQNEGRIIPIQIYLTEEEKEILVILDIKYKIASIKP